MIVVDSTSDDSVKSLEAIAQLEANVQIPVAVEDPASEPVAILFSTGSTGKPKG